MALRRFSQPLETVKRLREESAAAKGRHWRRAEQCQVPLDLAPAHSAQDRPNHPDWRPHQKEFLLARRGRPLLETGLEAPRAVRQPAPAGVSWQSPASELQNSHIDDPYPAAARAGHCIARSAFTRAGRPGRARWALSPHCSPFVNREVFSPAYNGIPLRPPVSRRQPGGPHLLRCVSTPLARVGPTPLQMCGPQAGRSAGRPGPDLRGHLATFSERSSLIRARDR